MGPPFESLPFSHACRRVDFDHVEVREGPRGGGRLLVVSGIKQWADLRVTLEPVAQREVRDFWVVEVVGRLAASGLASLVDFAVVLPVPAFAGCRGIEVVGATKAARALFNREGGEPCSND